MSLEDKQNQGAHCTLQKKLSNTCEECPQKFKKFFQITKKRIKIDEKCAQRIRKIQKHAKKSSRITTSLETYKNFETICAQRFQKFQNVHSKN